MILVSTKTPTLKQAHLQAAASPRSNQSLQKSLLCPPGKKNKKSPPLKKNKTLPSHNPTDKNGMTKTRDILKGMSLDKKEGQLVTCGIFYCRESAEINGCGSLQTSSRVDSDVLRNRQLTIPPNVTGHAIGTVQPLNRRADNKL